jgi:glycosyltransferase involved in cell wall biosynthesis
MSQLPVSIVVPTFDRREQLRQTLPACLRQEVQEIVVVDDGSPQPVEPLVRELAAGDTRVRTLRLAKNGGSPAARNAGADAATGEFVLFVDDDVLLSDGYARTLHDHRVAAGADAAAGRRIWLERGETPDQARRARTRRVAREKLVDRRHFAFDDEADFDGDVEVPMACAIMLVRRSWFARARFDETLYRRSGFREETDFQIQLARLGARLIACPHAVCFHLPRREIGRQGGQRNGKLLRYEWSLLANDAAFRRKHFVALAHELGFEPGLTPWLGALHHYFGFRVPSKLRHVLGAVDGRRTVEERGTAS